ncbi:MAG: hemerythrin domain-containing protein [Marinoscillum sp.]
MNIFEALREDHEKQRTLSEILVKTHGNSDGRDELFHKLKTELKAHSAAEERCFYKPLIEQDVTQTHARHGIAEHHEMDELIEQLENTEYSSPAWVSTAKKLREKILHHLDDEEHTIFQLAGKVLNDTQKTQMASAYQHAMEEHRNESA